MIEGSIYFRVITIPFGLFTIHDIFQSALVKSRIFNQQKAEVLLLLQRFDRVRSSGLERLNTNREQRDCHDQKTCFYKE